MRTRTRYVLLLATTAALCVAIITAVVAQPNLGCEPASAAVPESEIFTPADEQRSAGFDPVLPEADLPAVSSFSSLPGMESGALPPLQLEMLSASEAAYGYFFDRPVAGMLVSEFISGGGIQVHKEPVIDEAPFASYLLTTLGQRAVEVKVGDYQGALVWADPDSKGIRTHNLYWSDGEYNYALIADLSAQATLNMTRILVCGS